MSSTRILIALLMAFGLGVYVGKPTQITLQVPESPTLDCPQIEPVGGVVLINPRLTTTTTTSTTTSTTTTIPVEKEEKADDQKEESKVQDGTQVTDTDGDKIELNKWITDSVSRCARYVAEYEMDDCKISFSREQFAYINQLRTALTEANLSVIEEGALAIGNYVYYFKVRAK